MADGFYFEFLIRITSFYSVVTICSLGAYMETISAHVCLFVLTAHMSEVPMFRCLRTKGKSITAFQSRQAFKCKLNHLNSILKDWIPFGYDTRLAENSHFSKWKETFVSMHGKSLQNEMDDFIRIIRSIHEHFFRMTLTQKSVSSNCTIQVLSDSFLEKLLWNWCIDRQE